MAIFTGAGVAIVTPMKEGTKEVDYDAYGKLIDYQIEHGTDAIVACGTTGESATLSEKEHMEVIQYAIDYVNKRVPVIAGTGSNDTSTAVMLSKSAASTGVDALLCVTPYYNKTSQQGLVRHFNVVADSVDIPIILYNVPSRTGCNIKPKTYQELCKHPNIVAAKEASGDISQVALIRSLCGDNLDIYSGNDDQTVPFMSLGALGVISVFANICPKEMHDICQLCLDNDFAEAQKLAGSHIYMDVVTVGATINVMLAAVMAEGQTIIENAAKEPHVVDVANFLNCMGANIKGAGTDVIRIKGVSRLHGTEYTIIPDQIEAGTFMFAAAVTKGDVIVKNVIPKHLESISAKLLEIGCEIEESDDAVRVVASKPLTHTHVKTLPYPGFPTDMQPQITVTLGLSKGTSIVTESIFENRFKYVDELTRMGANIKVEGNTAIIDGVPGYTGASISAPDLRAGAALVIAALAAEGITTIDDIKYIERGYEDFHLKLASLGAQIDKISTERDLQKFRLKTG